MRLFGVLALSWLLRRHQRLDHLDQRWHIVLNNLPYSHQIEVQIIVGDPMAQANDLRPGDLGMCGSCLIRHLARCFTNVLQSFGDSVLVQGTPLELFPGQSLTELTDVSRGDQHIEQKRCVTPDRYAPDDSGCVCGECSSCSARPDTVRPGLPCDQTGTPVRGSSPTGDETPSRSLAQR